MSNEAKRYDGTVVRVAGNIISGVAGRVYDPDKMRPDSRDAYLIQWATAMARGIVAESMATEPKPDPFVLKLREQNAAFALQIAELVQELARARSLEGALRRDIRDLEEDKASLKQCIAAWPDPPDEMAAQKAALKDIIGKLRGAVTPTLVSSGMNAYWQCPLCEQQTSARGTNGPEGLTHEYDCPVIEELP